MAFDEAFRDLILVEKGYSDHPSDAGGKTMYGITEAIARANEFSGPMQTLTLETARRIYKAQFWDTLRLDDVDRLSPDVAYEIFEAGVNSGIGTIGRHFQRALTVMNRRGRDFPDLTVDGIVGPMTIAALRAYLRVRPKPEGESVMLKALNGQQCERFIDLAERRPTDEDFVYGWIRTRIAL